MHARHDSRRSLAHTLTRRCLGLAAGAPFGVEFGDKFHVSHCLYYEQSWL